MKLPLHVLLVEDNALDAILLREMFSKEPDGTIEMTHLLRMQDAEVRLAEGGFDIVLLDMGLPDAHGLDTIRRARAAAPGVPMIVLTGLDDEDLADQAMKEGAQDYLIKGQIENRALPRALRYAIERYRMQAEADLNQARQLQLKDEFLSHVSHELRSPLFAIYQFVTLVLDNLAGELQPAQRQYLEIVVRNVKQLQSMIDDLLEVTRAQAGKLTIDFQCASIEESIHFVVDTLQAAAAGKHILLSADPELPLPLVWADPKRIRQILIILVDNAIKFTPEAGTVHVRAHQRDPGFVTMEVADSGAGIRPDLGERIFERLFQATDAAAKSRNGLGLGLHICKELVLRQGGSIAASNAVGSGAVFSVKLPVFSLAALLAPAFREDTCAESYMLVVLEAAPKERWLSEEERVEVSQSVREVLQQCVYNDRDLLLPRLAPAGKFELFFLLAATDQVGAAALSKRVLKQLDDPEHIELADLVFAMSHRPVTGLGAQARESLEDRRNRQVAVIQRMMNEEISLRVAQRYA